MNDKPILPFEDDEAQASPRDLQTERTGVTRGPAVVLPRAGRWKDAARSRRERKRSEARGIEATREYLGTPAPLTMTPQAVFHWNRDDQVRELAAVRMSDPDVGFIARLLALCALPRTDPGDRRQWRRVNGPYELFMTATGRAQLPFGTLPRLLLAWVCTEAVRTGDRRLVLGQSLSEFMSKLGIKGRSGGVRGDGTRVQNQMQRLFGTAVHVEYADDERASSVALLVAERVDLWWDRRKDHPVLWNSTIELGEMFFNEIMRRPVPLDMHVLKAMKRSSLGLDLYLWLTYRTFGLREPLRLSWLHLYRQFAVRPAKADKDSVNAFRKRALRELRKLRTAWADLDYGLPRGYLELRPTRPRIEPRPAIGADPEREGR